MHKFLKKHKVIVAIVLVIVLILAARFTYNNVLVPWPYREELKACLGEARSMEDIRTIEMAEDECFRTYPHIN